MNLDSEPKLPALAEVLNGSAPPPYSLDNFRAFLCHNHCIGILNFLQCAKGYCEIFASVEVQIGHLSHGSSGRPEVELLWRLWRSLLSTFLLPGSSQEIDLSTNERTSLLAYRNAAIPPPPYVLEPLARRLYEHVEERMLPAFLFRGRDY